MDKQIFGQVVIIFVILSPDFLFIKTLEKQGARKDTTQSTGPAFLEILMFQTGYGSVYSVLTFCMGIKNVSNPILYSSPAENR